MTKHDPRRGNKRNIQCSTYLEDVEDIQLKKFLASRGLSKAGFIRYCVFKTIKDIERMEGDHDLDELYETTELNLCRK